ncbi:glycosyltransferase [Amycolatopsis sp. CA-230715]|uniref:glycosyltransferase n=1 Tax=Amycolatopsis sp. CA-230715 TaxID=2745196 RepID=UPI001C03375B|nr:glycosyltransferase [Amycolatopsis sp. CA-230715]QWF79811.1 hypothetical protein HUW46_03224 [Amycolatopsis sp. CA-230715]
MTAPRPICAVVVTHNSAAVIEDCLLSVQAAFAGLEDTSITLVDNGSTDDTLEIAATSGVRAAVLTQPNLGYAAGVNAGIAAAPESDILVLNPDIRLDPAAVRALRAAVTAPGTGIAVPELLDGRGKPQPSLRRRPTTRRAIGEALLGGTRAGRFPSLGELVVDRAAYERPGTADWATGACWLVSRECVDAVGRLDERYFLYSEETEYLLRAGDHGFAVRYDPRAVAVHLGGEQSTSDYLWALATTNRIRLRRERDGRVAATSMWLAVLGNELLRAAVRRGSAGTKHRRAVRELLRMPEWPEGPEDAGAPAYVCFAAQDWWYHNRAHSDFQLMRSIARRRKVLVVNSIGMRMPTPGKSTRTGARILRKLRSVAKFVRKPLPGFYVMSPLPLPFYGSPLLRKVNAVLVRAQVRAVCAALRIHRPAYVVTIPTAWDVVRPMPRRALVFNRSDRHSEFPEADRGAIEALEHGLLENADLVTYVSHALLDEERPRTGERAHFLDHGVDLEHFRPRARHQWPADLAEIQGPRIGFFGALDDFVVDFDLLERIAAELPDCSLVLIGDATHDMSRFDKYPNVHRLGFRPHETIPAYGSGFDVAIMPWLGNDWIRHANPIKLKEYLALGLPVVSTDFAELAGYTDRVRVAHDHAEFLDAIRTSIAEGAPKPAGELRASVRAFSWHSRADELTALVEGARATPEDRP